MAKQIDSMSPANGRMLGEDDSPINVADKLNEMNQSVVSSNKFRNAEVTFALNGTQSSELNLAAGEYLTALYMPDAWTASGGISFLSATAPGGTFGPVVEDTGIEAKVTAFASGAAGTRIPIVQNALAMKQIAGQVVKLRSGMAGAEVAQAAARTITVEVQKL